MGPAQGRFPACRRIRGYSYRKDRAEVDGIYEVERQDQIQRQGKVEGQEVQRQQESGSHTGQCS